MVKVLGLASCALTLAACGPSASGDSFERTSHACLPGVCPAVIASATGDAGIGNTPLEPWPDQNAGLLSGVYALHAFESATILGQPVTLQLLYRLRLLQDQGSGNVMQSNTLCALKLPSVPKIATLVIPPRLEALVPEVSDVVSQGAFISTSTSGVQTYNPPPLLLVVGAKLKDPTTDPLPTQMDPTNQWDEDMDGHPGVTVDATVFLCTSTQQLYVALRTGGTVTGTFSSQDTLDGTLNVTVEESVIGYSDQCLAATANVHPTLSPMSTFHAQRLADENTLDTMGNVSCADIIREAPMLYGSEWTN